jgi:hypothetical protein
VVAISTLVAASVIPGLAIGSFQEGRVSMGVEPVTLVTTFVLLGTGALMAMMTFFNPAPSDQDGRPRRSALWRVFRVVGGAAVLAGILAAAVGIGGRLPQTWDAVTPPMLVGLVLAALVTVAGATHRPGPEKFIDLRHWAGWGESATWRKLDDPFAGLPKLYWWTWRQQTLPMVVAFGALAAVVTVVVQISSRSAVLAERLTAMWNADLASSLLAAGMLLLAARLGDAAQGSQRLFGLVSTVTLTARQLRVLPVTSAHLVSFLLFRRAAGWAGLWLVAILFHVVVMGAPAQLRLDWLLGVIGIDTLVDAAVLRGRTSRVASIVVLGGATWLAFVLGPRLPADDTALASALTTLVGFAALAGAYLVHRASVTSGEDLYQTRGATP